MNFFYSYYLSATYPPLNVNDLFYMQVPRLPLDRSPFQPKHQLLGDYSCSSSIHLVFPSVSCDGHVGDWILGT